MKKLEVIAVATEVDREKYMIAKRPRGKDYGGLWEFPGGQRKKGETREQCAYREMWEEFPWMEIRILEYLGKKTYIDKEKKLKIELHGFYAVHLYGEFKPTEHEVVDIVYPHEFDSYDFAPADKPFVKLLQKIKNRQKN